MKTDYKVRAIAMSPNGEIMNTKLEKVLDHRIVVDDDEKRPDRGSFNNIVASFGEPDDLDLKDGDYLIAFYVACDKPMQTQAVKMSVMDFGSFSSWECSKATEADFPILKSA